MNKENIIRLLCIILGFGFCSIIPRNDYIEPRDFSIENTELSTKIDSLKLQSIIDYQLHQDELTRLKIKIRKLDLKTKDINKHHEQTTDSIDLFDRMDIIRGLSRIGYVKDSI